MLPEIQCLAMCNIFGHISTIYTQILMVWKAKFVFGLLHWYYLTSYQTNFTQPNIPNWIYWIQFVLNQIYLTKFIEQIYKAKSAKSNLLSKIFEI